MTRFLALILALVLSLSTAQGATTLLPNGKQCFSDVNGALAAGTVGMYTVGTLTTKATWQDSSQSSLNINPINLDANGCAIIYGVGTYRQILKNAAGTQIWDQVTTDTSSFNSVFWAGTSGGTPNVITVTYPGFTGTDGAIITFVALNTNTTSATLNPSGFGATSIFKDTGTGPSALSGGEIVAGNTVSVVYVASAGNFRLLNLISATSSASAPLCGASGFSMSNNVALPSVKMDITARTVLMTATSGTFVTRSSVSVNVNTTVTGAGGLDVAGPTVSSWYYVFLIDNGIAANTVSSLSSTAPIMPSGYSYSCLLGTIRVNSSGNLLNILQKGPYAEYVVAPATNVTAFPVIASFALGSSATAWTAFSVASFYPTAIATRVRVALGNVGNGSNVSGVGVAPNGNFATSPSTATNAGPLNCGTSNQTNGFNWCTSEVLLQSASVYIGAFSSTTWQVAALGWFLPVNAN